MFALQDGTKPVRVNVKNVNFTTVQTSDANLVQYYAEQATSLTAYNFGNIEQVLVRHVCCALRGRR